PNTRCQPTCGLFPRNKSISRFSRSSVESRFSIAAVCNGSELAGFSRSVMDSSLLQTYMDSARNVWDCVRESVKSNRDRQNNPSNKAEGTAMPANMSTNMSTNVSDENQNHAKADLDIVIAGGGYVGLVTAVSIKSAAPHLSVTVIDAAPVGAWKNDPRASSIAAAATRMLDKIGVWQEILPNAQPITDMIITDSRTSDPVRPVFLTFAGEVNPGEPFAHMVENRVLNTALHDRGDALGIRFVEATGV